jgi:two-component system, NarL family, nitrate/nitrite response regulator NarL
MAVSQGGAMAVRVLLVSDVRLYREGLQQLLQGAQEINLVGVAAQAEQAVDHACKLTPAVVVLALAMSECFSVARCLARTCTTSKCIVLGVPEVEAEVIAGLRAGIAGFVTQDGSMTDMLDAIRAAARGELYCSSNIAHLLFRRIAATAFTQEALDPIDGLTVREKQILNLLMQGMSNKMISRSLGIGLPTAKNHVHSIFAKLGVHGRAEAISVLYRQGSSSQVIERDRGVMAL